MWHRKVRGVCRTFAELVMGRGAPLASMSLLLVPAGGQLEQGAKSFGWAGVAEAAENPLSESDPQSPNVRQRPSAPKGLLSLSVNSKSRWIGSCRLL